GGGYGGS
nr:Chain A, 7-mer peptide from Heterogeneous nuclear ribonucleoprotein A1 [Homo sapiens]5ZGL_B Chain B, 7-mer peptide from Heterogeneous nuclear ribonucleoprotein A1 [Homo sapiens]